MAARYRQQGWIILAQNYRRRATELDIVACKQDTVVFIEVKARRQIPPLVGIVAALISSRKQAALQRGACAYLQEHAATLHWKQARFDLVVLMLPLRDPVGVLFFPDVF